MNKVRRTVNVSLQKRNLDKLNNILNTWDADGYNISNEICEAILFKVASDTNPHICTILSTLSLIESSIKSQKEYRDLSIEDIKTIALNIFNEVITIDIDGSKLTHLLKGGYKISKPEQIKETCNPKNELDSCTEKDAQEDVPCVSAKEEPTQNNNNEKLEDKHEKNCSHNHKTQEESVEISSRNSSDSSSPLDWRSKFPKEDFISNDLSKESNSKFDDFVFSSSRERYA